MENFNKSICTILNIQVDNLSMNEVMSKVCHGFIVTPNVDHLIHLQKDEDFIMLINPQIIDFVTVKF